MARTYRVSAFGMHDAEIDTAMTILSQPQKTEAFAFGVADDSQVAELEKIGLVVQKTEIDAAGGSVDAVPETPGLGASFAPGMRRMTTFTTRAVVDVSDAVDLTQPNIYLLHLRGPLLPEFSQRLGKLGVQLLERFGGDYYTAKLGVDQANEVRNLDFIDSATIYDARHTAPGALAGLAPPPE